MAVVRSQIPVSPENPYALGRHVYHDSASRNYPADIADRVIDVFHQSQGLPLNQGQIGKCTAESLCGRLNTQPGQPAATFRIYTDVDSDELYEKETADEGAPWSPSDPLVNDNGGSGLAVCKAGVQLGWIKSYGHTFNFQDALKGLAKRPFITGMNWYESMFSPDENGLVTISPGSSVAGGHEVLCVQNMVEAQILGFWNSWGQGFGKGGMFYINYATFERLLSEQGDVTFPYVR